jgi:hypothetical protein
VTDRRVLLLTQGLLGQKVRPGDNPHRYSREGIAARNSRAVGNSGGLR